jgi:hypothetical protein
MNYINTSIQALGYIARADWDSQADILVEFDMTLAELLSSAEHLFILQSACLILY